MGRSRRTEAQIIAALKQVEAGCTVDDVARECGVSQATIYTWKSKFGSMDVSGSVQAPVFRTTDRRRRSKTRGPLPKARYFRRERARPGL